MTSCDSIGIGEWIFLFLWSISVPTYSMVIYTIWKHRKTNFKGEFWLLTMALFPADMLHLCQLMWAQKMSAWGLLPSILKQAPKLVGWIMMVPKWSFFFAEVMGVVFISLNRYMAIAKSSTYTVLWTRKVTILCICVQWGTAAFVLLSMATFDFTLEPSYYHNGTGFIAVIERKDKQKAGVFLGFVVGLGGILRVLLFIILYGHMLYYVSKHNRVVAAAQSQHHQPSPSSSRAEFNLAMIGGLLALCDMALTLSMIQVAVNMNELGDKVGLERSRYWMFRGVCFSDIYGWMNGWVLLAFSSTVRQQFIGQYGWAAQPVTSVFS